MRAGTTAGMAVLDIGCGTGEVSLLLAKIVGPDGHVIGIDIDAPSLEIAPNEFSPASHKERRRNPPGQKPHVLEPTVRPRRWTCMMDGP